MIKFKKQVACLISGMVALSFLTLVGLNGLSKGNWSPAQITVIVGTALASAASAFLYFRAQGDYEVRLANLAISFFSLALALILVEILARVYLWEFASQEQFNKYASVNQLQKRYGQDYPDTGGISPHRYVGYIPAPNYQAGLNKHNSLGFRGDEIQQPKPEGVFRIVCIGGSTTYSQAEDYTKAYPFLLQEYLHQAGYTNVEVINAGMIGYTSWESLVNLEFRVLDLEPDLLIIYHAINDVYPRIVWPPDNYRGDNSGLRILRLQPVQMPPIWEYSTALRMAAITRGISEPHSGLEWQFIEHPQTAYADLFVEQKAAGTYPSGIFDEVSAETMLQENLPRYFERNLTNMVSIAKGHDINVVLLTFAYSPHFADPRVGSEVFQTGIAEGNEVVRSIAAETGTFLYDFADDMPTDREYFTDGQHYTERGNEVRVSLIGGYLIETGILPE